MELDLVEYDIDTEIKKQVEAIIQNLLGKASATVVILTDDAGRIVEIKGNVKNQIETEFLGTLISGVFGAAVEMGKLLHMDLLDSLQYESKNMDVVIKYIPPRFLLGVIVGKEVSLGRVRLFLKEATSALEKVLQNAKMVPVRTVKMDVAELEKKLSQIILE